MSTNFDPEMFYKTRSLQYYGDNSGFISIRTSQGYAFQDMQATRARHTFKGNFFMSQFFEQYQDHVNTTSVTSEMPIHTTEPFFKTYGAVFLKFEGQVSTKIWYRTSFSDFLSTFGGLMVSVLAATRFLMSGYHKFAQEQAMAGSLYREKASMERALSSEAATVKESFESAIRSRRKFDVSFCAFFFNTTVLRYCCCCLKKCFKAQADKYRKFQLAVQRLSKEQDIQNIIEMNRITRFLHKTFFFARQRRTISHAHRYVIADKDINAASKQTWKEFEDFEDSTARILKGFDPENDKMDRRLLYEVTGLVLNEDEFFDSDSSGSDDDQVIFDSVPAVHPLDHAFNYQQLLRD